MAKAGGQKAGGQIALRFTITGDEMTLMRVQALETKVQKRVLTPALRAAAKIIQAQAKANVRSRSGVTKQSIQVRAGKRSRKFPNRVTVNVITAKGWFRGPAFYAGFTERGWKAGSRKSYSFGGVLRHRLGFRWINQRIPVKGQRWLARASEAKHAEAQAIIHRLVLEGIEKEARTSGK